MLAQIEEILKKKNLFFHKNQGITVASIPDPSAGFDLTKEILYQIVDRKTVLYLSGGSTPKTLYSKLAKDEIIKPGAVGQMDERYGAPFHKNSNQLMIKGTGLTRYLEILDIPFYSILEGKTREETADDYDQKIRELNTVFSRSVAVLGIGEDGHTAGIPAQNSQVSIPDFQLDNYSLVTDYNDKTGMYKERVTMTYLGLEMLDLMIVLVLGSAKQNSLELMFTDGKEEEIPARFFKKPEIAKKTLLITDQSV